MAFGGGGKVPAQQPSKLETTRAKVKSLLFVVFLVVISQVAACEDGSVDSVPMASQLLKALERGDAICCRCKRSLLQTRNK